MSTRILKLAACVLGVMVLGYITVIAWVLLEFRTHTYTIRDAPNAFTDDAAILKLSASALLLHGADPAAYFPGTYWGGVNVGHNENNPDRVTTNWIGTPGFGIALEQQGPDVVCYVTRSK